MPETPLYVLVESPNRENIIRESTDKALGTSWENNNSNIYAKFCNISYVNKMKTSFISDHKYCRFQFC